MHVWGGGGGRKERKKEKRKNREGANQALSKNLAPLSSGKGLKGLFPRATWEEYLRILKVCLRIKHVLKSDERDLLKPPYRNIFIFCALVVQLNHFKGD